MARLSLCMIARDEAVFLGRCIDSVKAIVDEVIVVDTGSVDATKDIAARSGAKVFDLEWADDFSVARNHALDQATGDWVLVLDADETISESDHGRLMSLASENKADAYSLVQRTYGNKLKHAEYVSRGADVYAESQAYAGWIPSRLVRLFRNDKNYRFRYRIHEVIEPSIEERGGVVCASEIPIHHFTYEKNPDFIDSKLKRYLDYGLKQIEATPQDPKP
ncbi:MAG: glycosyltransferase family 2 protein, partial [Acidiferrobacterales bacterium]